MPFQLYFPALNLANHPRNNCGNPLKSTGRRSWSQGTPGKRLRRLLPQTRATDVCSSARTSRAGTGRNSVALVPQAVRDAPWKKCGCFGHGGARARVSVQTKNTLLYHNECTETSKVEERERGWGCLFVPRLGVRIAICRIFLSAGYCLLSSSSFLVCVPPPENS